MPDSPPPVASTDRHYLNETVGLRSWLLTRDHKRIGWLYLLAITTMFVLGGLAAMIIRIELMSPPGDLVAADTYNRLFSVHGIVMVFFFLVPSIPAVFGNFLLPLMLGAKDVAFPRLNLLSWYLFVAGCALMIADIARGGVDTGWTFYAPFSTTRSESNVVLAIVAIFVAGFSSILTGVNFIVTIHRMRAPGLRWFRLPLFIWSMYATSIIFVLGTPVVAITLTCVVLDRVLHLGIFDPQSGGDPVLFQHLFWFYSHPAVYIMVLPAMGVTSELISAFSRKPVFGYNWVAGSSLAIAIIGFLVWGHHLFVSSQSVWAGTIFSLFSFFVAIPSAVKVFNWTATLHRGSIAWDTPLFYAIGFIGLFTMGGLTGLFLATMGLDIPVHDTYFVIAHFHFIMVGGSVMGYFGALHYWWPKMTGRLYSQPLGNAAAALIFVGFIITFLPQFILGTLGMPRRYHAYPHEFQVLNVMSTAGASILALGYLLPMVYLLWSLRYGPVAGANPWRAVGLEWKTSSPPPTQNFLEPPVVHEEDYDFRRAVTQVSGPLVS